MSDRYTTTQGPEGEHLSTPVPARCPDCNRPTFYDDTIVGAGEWHHAIRAAEPCFLIGPEGHADDLGHPLLSTLKGTARLTEEYVRWAKAAGLPEDLDAHSMLLRVHTREQTAWLVWFIWEWDIVQGEEDAAARA